MHAHKHTNVCMHAWFVQHPAHVSTAPWSECCACCAHTHTHVQASQLRQAVDKLRNEDRSAEFDEYAAQRVNVLREELEAEIRLLSDKINAEKDREKQWLVDVLKFVTGDIEIQVRDSFVYVRMGACICMLYMHSRQ